MAEQHTKTVRIAFHYLADQLTGDAVTDTNWVKRITKLSKRTKPVQVEHMGRELEGIALSTDAYPAVALSTDRAIAPRQRNRQTGARSNLPISPDHEPIEEAFVRFFDNGIVGIVMSSLSAPHPSAIATWLTTACKGPEKANPKSRWAINPLIRPDTLDAVRASDVRKLTLKMAAGQVDPEDKSLYGTLFKGALGFDDRLNVEVSVSAGRGAVGARSRDEVQDVLDSALPHLGKFKKATIEAVRPEKEIAETINLLRDRFSTHAVVSVDQRTLDHASVMTEVSKAYAELSEALLEAHPGLSD